MSDNIIKTGLLSDLSIQSKTKKQPKANQLGQDAFLKLMITQMKNQNPLEPQKNSEFVAQLAQFSSVEGIDKLNKSVAGIATSFQSGQALQASSLVGRTVKVPATHAELATGGNVAGTIELPYSTPDLRIDIFNSAGQLVGQQLLGGQEAGKINFNWNGQAGDGSASPAGRYRFAAVAMKDGKPEQLETALGANVDSVTVGSGGAITLNIAGVGAVPMSKVTEIL